MMKLFLIVGIVGIMISGICIGAWIDGQQQRANYYSETTEQRKVRTKVGIYAGLIGMICLGISGLIYFF
ncbi:hypothetical protein CVD25_01210 [Bacillus canaveralius]|uniref:Uncharacterized protein n=1 Tax=Bacillus canaveralius TaxID=1403243 RepID=A0A2N5GMZ9_9BACI|nr:DUF5316 family protein [Bacillus canaveralius]PLR83525.1 hypothetical protein CU635_08830 [Bacillus canaveralius]PLS00711.1 hypothetical protein CVD25_01210 [Bacillus canaveralius]